jgi:hypothetical protein
LSSIDPNSGRDGSGQLVGDWADKTTEVRAATPLHRRRWVRTVLFCLGCAAGLAAALAIAWFSFQEDRRDAETERQRHCLRAFLNSAEFTRFVRAMDEETVAILNYIASRPLEAHPLMPELAALDKARRELPWTTQVMPLPVSARTNPPKIAQASREVNALLFRRGYVVDDAAREAARQYFLSSMLPFTQEFMRRQPANVFSQLMRDRSMQEEALAAFVRQHGPDTTIAQMERFLTVQATIGSALRKALEQKRAPQSQPPAAGAKR